MLWVEILWGVSAITMLRAIETAPQMDRWAADQEVMKPLGA
jgi:hypothetical protein